MLTCPHCLHTFEPTPSTSSSLTSSSHHCCAPSTSFLFAQPSPCVRVFADSGGGIVVTSPTEKVVNPFPQVQLSFSQPSPSVQLSFVLPTPWIPSVTPPPQFVPPVFHHYASTADTDLERLSTTQRALRTSGWYYEGLSWQESATTLDQSAPGTFLIRDSSDPRFLFSLSVQTSRGPTSVRLHYINGQFRLDAEERLVRYIPMFDCVLRLVEYYIALGKRKLQDSNNQDNEKEGHVLVDLTGHMYSPILLIKPKRRTVPSLQHLSRISINQRLQTRGDLSSLNLPQTLETYLRDYPYKQ